MKSFFIYKNDAMRVGEAPKLPYYEEWCHHPIPPVMEEQEIPSYPIKQTRDFRGYRAYQGNKEIMIYVEF